MFRISTFIYFFRRTRMRPHGWRVVLPCYPLAQVTPSSVRPSTPLTLTRFGRSLQLPPASRWRYSRGWALASSTMCLQASRFLALSFHSFKPIFLRSMYTSSSHLIFGLPLRLVAYSFPYNIFFLELRCLAFFLCDQATVFFGI